MLPPNQPHPPGDPSPQTESSEFYPASLAQRRMWFLDQLQGPTAAYNVHVGLWLYGALNLRALQSGLQELVNRHDTLRTTFRLEQGELIQVVGESYPVALHTTDFAGVPDPYPQVYELAKREVETPFDLSKGPLFRARVFRIATEEHVLLCTMHHTITDAWSMQVFVKELALLYEEFPNEEFPNRPSASLPKLPIQYGDYAEWQQQSLQTLEARQQLAYWKDALEDAPPVLKLPQDGPRPAEQTLQGASHAFPVPGEIVAPIASLATRHHVTPFMVLLAAFKVLLYRYSGEADLLVAVPVAGRNQVETEGMIGFFVNTLVLRDDLSGNPRFLDLLAQVRESTLGAFANAEVPFEKVVDVLQPERTLSYNPVFQVMFSVIKSAIRSHAFGNVSSYPYVVDTATSIVDLSATIIEDSDGKWWLHLEYNTDLFHHERIGQMVDDYVAVLRAIAADPEVHIDDLRLPSIPQPGGMIEPLKVDALTRFGSRLKPRKPVEPAIEEQALLSEIWKDVLGLAKIGIHDNFFDVGGHSLLAARLMARIQDATGRKVPVSAIFRAPTIASLALVIKNNSVSESDPALMQIHRGTGGVPFFAVAAPGVNTLGLALLARHLGERPVYKLQGNGPLIWERPFEREELRALAREHVAAMRTVQPNGPFCLGGMCDGVLIAQEIILQLESEGEEVALFVIFDTWVLENSQIRALWAIDYYLHRLRTLRDLPLKEQLATARRVSRRLLGRNGSVRSAWGETYWPGEDFEPPRFQAPVLLFKKPRQPYYRVRDPYMGWGARSTSGVDICEIDCGHFELLRPPNVQVVGQRLAQRLQQIMNERVRRPSLAPVVAQPVRPQPGLGANVVDAGNCQA
jgi:thioesterase domain-containing protein